MVIGNGISNFDTNDDSLLYFGYYHGLIGEVWVKNVSYFFFCSVCCYKMFNEYKQFTPSWKCLIHMMFAEPFKTYLIIHICAKFSRILWKKIGLIDWWNPREWVGCRTAAAFALKVGWSLVSQPIYFILTHIDA